MYDYYEEPYYETTLADEIFIKYLNEMKNALTESVKQDIDNIKNDNERLKEENNKYKKREKDILNKENDLKYKEENLKREVTNEFYKSNIGDTLKQYIEECEVWFADIDRYQNQKCDLCNEERKLVAKFPNGEITKTACNCAKILSKYIPAISAIAMIKFGKRDGRYSSDRKYYLNRTYSPPNNRNDYDHDYQEFKICHVVDEFNESIVELHKNKSYGEKLGFKNKEECQKYCDWLNKSKEEDI